MNKSYLEKKIKEKAEKRLYEDEMSLRDFAERHPILRKLCIVESGTDGKEHLVGIIATNGVSNQLFFAGMGRDNQRCKKTNINKIRDELLEKYEKQELESVLDKLSSVGYLFQD